METGTALTTNDDNLNDILVEVGLARSRQDDRFGGAAHDDAHTHQEWVEIIKSQIAEAISTDNLHCGKINPDVFEQQMIETAAVAIAAVQASRRRRRAGIDGQRLDPALSENKFQDILFRNVKIRYAIDVETRLIEGLYGESNSPELYRWCERNHILMTSIDKFGIAHVEFSQDDSEFWRQSGR